MSFVESELTVIFYITNDTSFGRTERVGLMSEQKQNLASKKSEDICEKID